MLQLGDAVELRPLAGHAGHGRHLSLLTGRRSASTRRLKAHAPSDQKTESEQCPQFEAA
jgi:hypothetical protein